jgi:long-chain-acyl-CoA dehydrogenase
LCAFQSHSSGSLLDIGTRRIFNEDHDMFRETARKYFEEHVKPYHGVRPIQPHSSPSTVLTRRWCLMYLVRDADEWEKQGMVSRDCWLRAGELGLLGCTTSDKYGGSGTDAKYAAIVWEEQAYRCVPIPFLGALVGRSRRANAMHGSVTASARARALRCTRTL